MNELFAADPAVCASANELKLLLSSFGPYAGRYLANYPIDWAAQVERKFESAGEIETARVRTLLRRARESSAMVTRNNLAWNSELAWLANAMPLLGPEPTVFEALVSGMSKPPSIHRLDELDLPPTAEERIEATASEYARISKILLIFSPELTLVDPYLNPLKRQYSDVLQALFNLAAKGKCQKVSMWARASEFFGSRTRPIIMGDLEDKLRRLASRAQFRPGREIEMLLVDDESRETKMHGRYLLSIKGGIRLDQGFQELPAGRHVDVGPIGKSTLDDLLDIHFDDKHDMQVIERLSFEM